MAAAVATDGLDVLVGNLDNSFVRELKSDASEAPNRTPRAVKGAHYVPHTPTALKSPYVVAIAPAMAEELGLGREALAKDPRFAKVFSADVGAAGEGSLSPWVTPYAVSCFGHEILSPDPFNGDGYGDGRASSLGEFSIPGKGRWELQLKGSGPTPFARGGDGRAVLRSSIREYLVSEAMHHMGVPTTRAFCLVGSKSDRVLRAWYAEDDRGKRDHPPNVPIEEPCAITTRAAPSFIRIGHLELFARRTQRGVPGARERLSELIAHAIRREFPDLAELLPADSSTLVGGATLVALLRAVAQNLAVMAAGWLRVGYVQGNMNSDNCLLSGRTMDYGPFGFVEQFSPLWSPFTSDPERKFGFLRQPLAAQVNLVTLARALLPLADEATQRELEAVVKNDYPAVLEKELADMRRRKLGFPVAATEDGSSSAAEQEKLWDALVAENLLDGVDYTIFWRTLAKCAEVGSGAGDAADDDALFKPLLDADAFYDNPDSDKRVAMIKWIRNWLDLLRAAGAGAVEAAPSVMRAASPKYIPREWMLVEAYEAAAEGDHAPLLELEKLFAEPFDEQSTLEKRYFRRTPAFLQQKGGVSFYS
eukprot:CAMPEP_0170137472 /NCGR_PEP_ID=MMETSP0033_2-20121228/4180_1 /TAXON_ID=195969 /ORGANISM="Dolichomastix tenuilepis, Strain CCMP3274" /LENGTH=590 /DNA_ID=CAMNT_0010373347 /DNA_START=88 /DNA_END=1860 /DNA_ORIENTATION=-